MEWDAYEMDSEVIYSSENFSIYADYCELTIHMYQDDVLISSCSANEITMDYFISEMQKEACARMVLG